MKNDEWRQEIEGKDFTPAQEKAFWQKYKMEERRYKRLCQRRGIPYTPPAKSERTCPHAARAYLVHVKIGASGQVLGPSTRSRPRTGATILAEAEATMDLRWPLRVTGRTPEGQQQIESKRSKFMSNARAEAEALDRDIEREHERQALRDLELADGFDCLGQPIIPFWMTPGGKHIKALLAAEKARPRWERMMEAEREEAERAADFEPWAEGFNDSGGLFPHRR